MSEFETNDDLDFLSNATRIVRYAATLARTRFGRADIVTEKAFHDVVTDADLAIEQEIVESLSKAYPDHGFHTEEQGKQDTTSEYVWILDPIDGTKYYSRGVPLYAISLALERCGQLMVSVVFDPQSQQLFTASRGGGAALNGIPINCSRITRLRDAILCVELASSDSPFHELELALDRFSKLVRKSRRARVLGVSSLGLCYCAMGGFDAYVNLGSSAQHCDVAAGTLIVEEAGATCTSIHDTRIAGPALLVNELIDLLQD